MPAPAGKAISNLSVDFSQVEDRREGGKAAHVPEGDYLLRVDGCEKRQNKAKDGEYLAWKMGIAKPEKYKTKGFIYHNTSLKPEALWNLRNFLEDLGLKIEKKTLNIPIAKIVANHMLIGATLQDGEPYNDKVKSEIAATFHKSKFEDTGEEEEEETDDEETTESDTTDASDDDDSLDELDVDDL